MVRSKVRHRSIAEINMVPFIDIMMVMLVAFMVSAPMLTQGISVDLPKTSSKLMPLPDEAKTLIISIRSDGRYFIDLGGDQDSAKDINDISRKVSKVVAASPNTKVLVKGDRAVSYGAVVELMSGLQSAGVEDVGLVTDPVSLSDRSK